MFRLSPLSSTGISPRNLIPWPGGNQELWDQVVVTSSAVVAFFFRGMERCGCEEIPLLKQDSYGTTTIELSKCKNVL